MSKKHSKKRNVGLMYEFLVRVISVALLEGDKKKSSRALKIMKRYFKPGTELYNEFRLVHSLKTVSVSSESVASTIVERAREVAKGHNASQLMREKSLLIREVNHTLNDNNFYDQPVQDYRMYATIQSLIDEWRNPTGDIRLLAEYEDKLVKWMSSDKTQVSSSPISEEDPGTTRLLVKVMTQKLNEKYSEALLPEQRVILREYGLAVDGNKSALTTMLENVKQRLLTLIESNQEARETELTSKLLEFKDKLLSENLHVIDDETIIRFMLYTKLSNELKGVK